jgi:hypothetical protein
MFLPRRTVIPIAVVTVVAISLSGTIAQSHLITSISDNTSGRSNNGDSPPVMKVVPVAEPQPALAHRFWPARNEMKSGNAFVGFNRAVVLLSQHIRTEKVKSDQFWQDWSAWIDLPLEELPVEKIRTGLEDYEAVFKEVERAYLLRDSDYQLMADDLVGLEFLELPLPEFQEMRSVARLLALRARTELREGRVDDAIHTLQIGFRMGEVTGQATDLIIARLVGLAITRMMLAEVENCMVDARCPNLYWALATIPNSSTEVMDALLFESNVVTTVFPTLGQLPDDALSDEAWEQRLVQVVEDLDRVVDATSMDTPASYSSSRLKAGLAILTFAESSRRALIDAGVPAEQVSRMSAAEAVLRATRQSVANLQQEFSKWAYLPDSIRRPYLKRSDAVFSPDQRSDGSLADTGSILAGLLLPAVNAADASSYATKQHIARLVTIEAIRDFVAKNQKVPTSLDDLQDLPAWPDPIRGGPFGYTKIDQTMAELSWAPRHDGDTATSLILQFDIKE